MKKLALPIVLILLLNPILVNSQPVTSISGKVENFEHNNYAELIIETFDIDILEKRVIEIDGRINKTDGTFKFITNDIKEPYTLCWIRLGWEKVRLVLNPGDSIIISGNLRYLEQSIDFSGIGSGKNQYRKEYHLQFTDRDATKEIRRISKPQKFLPRIKDLIARKHQLLNDFLQEGMIDSVYYNYESIRLQYVLYKEILMHFKSHTENYLESESLSDIEEIVKEAEINNEAFVLCPDYRSFVKYYVYYETMQQSDDHATSYLDQIDFAQSILGGTIYQYVVKDLIKGFSKNANTNTELVIGLKSIAKKVNDPLLLKTIEDYNSRANRNRVDSDLTENAMIIVLIICILFVLIFLVRSVKLKFNPITKKSNAARWLIISIYLLTIALIVSFLEELSNKYVPYFSFQFLLLAGIYLAHTFLIIPSFFYKPKKHLYYISLLLLLGITIAFALYTRSIAYENGIAWDSALEVTVYSQTWLAVTLVFSWFGYYMHYLAKRSLPLSYPFKNKMIDREIMVTTLILLIVNIIFAANIGSSIKLPGILTFYSAIAIFLVQTFWFVPKFLFQKKFNRFLIFNLTLLFVLSICMILSNAIHSAITLSSYGMEFDFTDIINIKHSVRIDKLFTSLLIIVPASFYNYIKYLINERETEGFRLYRNKEAELMHLRSQVNPHFLFNNLNTLYSFALKEKSDRTAESIAKLANLMRYMIDDMDKETIALKKEVDYIQDYIKLQSIRSSVEHNIQMNVTIDCEDECVIAPMLLIPFVENAFKHGINPNKVSEMLIDIKGQKDEIQFVIENNVDKKFEAFYKEKGFGIGIDNVRKRLEYLYPGKHTISVASAENRFIVIISIKLDT